MDRTSPRWERLRAPFKKDEIELLPKFTGKRVKGNPIPREAYKHCDTCGGYHPFPCVHLKYVGHANITMRLNEVDPAWNWEPVATDADGLPLVKDGSLWIRLTVLGITRLGVGDAQGKSGPDAMKEIVGDALRNAAMRFGVGTYLWSKSERAARMADFIEDDQPDGDGKEGGAEPATAPIDAYRETLVKARNAGLSIKACMADVQAEIGKPPEEFGFPDVVRACVIVEREIAAASKGEDPQDAPEAPVASEQPDQEPPPGPEEDEVVINFD